MPRRPTPDGSVPSHAALQLAHLAIAAEEQLGTSVSEAWLVPGRAPDTFDPAVMNRSRGPDHLRVMARCGTALLTLDPDEDTLARTRAQVIHLEKERQRYGRARHPVPEVCDHPRGVQLVVERGRAVTLPTVSTLDALRAALVGHVTPASPDAVSHRGDGQRIDGAGAVRITADAGRGAHTQRRRRHAMTVRLRWLAAAWSASGIAGVIAVFGGWIDPPGSAIVDGVLLGVAGLVHAFFVLISLETAQQTAHPQRDPRAVEAATVALARALEPAVHAARLQLGARAATPAADALPAPIPTPGRRRRQERA